MYSKYCLISVADKRSCTMLFSAVFRIFYVLLFTVTSISAQSKDKVHQEDDKKKEEDDKDKKGAHGHITCTSF